MKIEPTFAASTSSSGKRNLSTPASRIAGWPLARPGTWRQRQAGPPELLQRASDVMPFTYAYDGLAKIAADDIGGRLWLDVGVVIGCIGLALALGATTLRRRTA